MTVRFVPAGDLGERLARNKLRLESERYTPTLLGSGRAGGFFRDDAYDWPGDFEGRTLLAWTLLERSTGLKSQHLAQALDVLPRRMNAGGYLGPLIETGVQDEQQLAGHGWLLRALCESWQGNGDPATYAMIERIVANLAMPTAGFHATYPIDPTGRSAVDGSFVGERSECIGSWRLSTDIGCDFIFLDGLAHAATIVGRSVVDRLVGEIIARFLDVDLIGIGAQTHASLTGVRALLRWSMHTGSEELLAAAIERFELYLVHGASENHANWNWFGRPTHTEPCAMVDAFMIACQLWERTSTSRWLEEAQLIFYNGLGHAQRSHGGFGCDSVLGGDPDEPEMLRVAMDEAWWCCSMRGAEGLSTARDHAVQRRGGELIFPFLFSGRLEVSRSEAGVTETWECETTYPRGESFNLRRIGGGAGPVDLAFFVPSWADGPTVTLDGIRQEGSLGADRFLRIRLEVGATSRVEFSFALQPQWHPVRNASSDRSLSVARRGPLQYGWSEAERRTLSTGRLDWDTDQEGVRLGDYPLTPINDMIDRSDLAGYRRQFLFAPPADSPV